MFRLAENLSSVTVLRQDLLYMREEIFCAHPAGTGGKDHDPPLAQKGGSQFGKHPIGVKRLLFFGGTFGKGGGDR